MVFSFLATRISESNVLYLCLINSHSDYIVPVPNALTYLAQITLGHKLPTETSKSPILEETCLLPRISYTVLLSLIARKAGADYYLLSKAKINELGF